MRKVLHRGGEFGPSLVDTPGGTFLYFSSTGTSGNHDIYRSRMDGDGGFETPQAMAELNSAPVDQMPNVSSDGTEVVFRVEPRREHGHLDRYLRRIDRTVVEPVPVAAVNTAEPETRPSLSGDGSRLFLGRGATADVYVSTRVEIED